MFTGTFFNRLGSDSKFRLPEPFIDSYGLPGGQAGVYTIRSDIGAVALLTVDRINAYLMQIQRMSAKNGLHAEALADDDRLDLGAVPGLMTELVRERPVVPWYNLDGSDRPRDLVASLLDVTSLVSPQERGRRLEDAVAEALSSVGIDVQRRVRLNHGEADLLICERSVEGGTRLTIIECKEQSRSGRRVTLAPVLKLLGLRTATRTGHSAKAAVMVSTSGYTSDAHELGQAEGIALTDYSALMEHLSTVKRAPEPLLRYQPLSRNGATRFASSDADWIGERDLTVIGVSDRVEVWGTVAWDEYTREREDSFRDIQEEIFPGF